eukprot:2537854-Pleurochrysis_carterae.AAC.1
MFLRAREKRLSALSAVHVVTVAYALLWARIIASQGILSARRCHLVNGRGDANGRMRGQHELRFVPSLACNRFNLHFTSEASRQYLPQAEDCKIMMSAFNCQ